jgi:hypothetical protein
MAPRAGQTVETAAGGQKLTTTVDTGTANSSPFKPTTKLALEKGTGRLRPTGNHTIVHPCHVA